ncbi:MAG: sodium:alanine symporter family protein [Clostridia bacterium]|nr:sodium:alanine symporter family protein [Clostridia bacterium]
MMKWLLTGGLVPLLLLGSGAFFCVYLRGLPLRRPGRMLASLRTPTEGTGTSPFRAVMLALAGTLGVGNIVGVANAIAVGGAGAVFWMWISALFAMLLKYAEILLAVLHRRIGPHGFFGGAYYYIKDCFAARRWKKTAAVLSSLFALFMIVDALSMGCVIQVNAVSAAFSGVLGIPPWVSGLLLVLLTLPVLLRGSRGIAGLTEILVPIMTGGYLILSIGVLLLKRDAVGEALGMIFREAFSGEGIAGGVVGFLTSKALRVGTMRGLLSNEGGCGTAPTAHAAANVRSGATQGIWGIFEVFVDTILLCTVTALVILVSLPEVSMLGEDGVMMTIRAYSCVLGKWAEGFFCVAVFCFGYGTVLCWANYGRESLRFLTCRQRYGVLYLLLVGICVFLGAVAAPQRVWTLADLALTMLTTVNVITLMLLRREVRRETLEWAMDKGTS